MEHFISFSCAVFLAFIMRACSYHMVVTGSLFVCLGRVVAPVLYLFFTQAALAQSSSAVDPKYAEAIQSYKKSDYSVALERLAQIIESDSGSVRATQRTIDIYRELDHLDSAMDYFTSIVAQFDSNQLANLGLGLVLIELGRVTEAVAPLTLAVEIDPREVSPWMALARAYRSNDDTAAVIQAFEALGALCPECPGSHLGLALLHRRWWRMESSLRYLDSALTLDPGLLDAFNQKASISFAMGQLDDGLNLSKEGLSLAKARGDLFYESKFLGQVGAAYYYMGNLKEALTYWEGAAELSGQLAEKRDELGWLENIGVVHRELGNLTLALHYLTRVLQTVRELKDRSGEGHTLSNIGGVYVELGEYEKALACHEKALEIVRAENDRKGEAIDLGNIGLIYGYMGDYEKALEYGELALTIDRELGLTRDVSSDLGNIGVTYYEQGDYARALNLFHEALAAANKAGDMSLVAVWTQALSGTYYDLSDLSNALKYNTAALELFSETGERIATAECLGMRGLLKVESKEFDDGLESFQQALTVFSESGARRQEATAHVNIAAVHYQTGELDSAVVALTTALHINNEIGYSFGAAEAHNYLGLVYRIQDRLHEAIDSHEQALRLGEQISALKHVWQAQYGLGMVFEKQGDHRKALTHYCAAINTIEDIRGGLLPEEQKLTFFGSKDEIFEKIQDLMYEMWQQNPTVELVEESYTYSEKAKARTLLDLIAESRIDIRMGVDTALLRQEKRTLSKISKLQTNLSTEDPSSASLDSITTELEQLTLALTQVRADIKRNSPEYASVKYPEVTGISEVQQGVIGESDLLLEYSLGDDHSYVWAISHTTLEVFRLPPRNEISRQVKDLLDVIAYPPQAGVSHIPVGKTFYDVLIGPAKQSLASKKNLIIVPDGVLHHVPFEVLIEGLEDNEPRYLIESFGVRYAPSATVLRIIEERGGQRQSIPAGELLAMGDPDFGTEASSTPESGVTMRGVYESQGFQFAPLPFAAREVKAITSLFPDDATVSFLREKASEEVVKSGVLANYRRIHFASHALIDEELPSRSCVVFTLDDDPTEDGFLHLNEIFNIELNTDLVAISACETGLGKLVAGEGIVGLSRGFFYAGTNSLLLTLWSISDRSTATFMEGFYRGLAEGKDNSDALRTAKLSFVNGEVKALRHPFYWAPYVLMGTDK